MVELKQKPRPSASRAHTLNHYTIQRSFVVQNIGTKGDNKMKYVCKPNVSTDSYFYREGELGGRISREALA